MPSGNDASDLSREQFLHWHYAHQSIYLELKRIALHEKAAGRPSMTMSELLEMYENERTARGEEDITIPRCYAPFYQGLLSSHNTLWDFLRHPASMEKESIGG